MATATKRPPSPFQPADDYTSVFVVRGGTQKPKPKNNSLDTRYVEYINPERTIAVVGAYSGYDIVMRTSLTVADVVMPGSEYLTNDGYAKTREHGVWFEVKEGDKRKTHVRAAAEALLKQVQDVNDPLRVALDGKFAPALTIALKKVESERDYWRDNRRIQEVYSIAEEAGVSPILLALAIKEDRLIWSTPPVAPAQIMVVVQDEKTGVLSERLVDEIVLADREVEGLGRIVHQGSVPEYLLHRREFLQARSVEAILSNRDRLEKALGDVKSRVESLLASLEKGEVLGRDGLFGGLGLARDAEDAQAAAVRYAESVISADLPGDFAESLRNGTFRDNSRYALHRSDAHAALLALAALNGMEVNRY